MGYRRSLCEILLKNTLVGFHYGVDIGRYENLTVAGIVCLLDEPTNDLKIYALQKLDAIVDLYWAEIADEITKMYPWFM
jgi:hypothetical protein